MTSFDSALELLQNLQEMANKTDDIEIFREQLKVIIWGLKTLGKEKE